MLKGDVSSELLLRPVPVSVGQLRVACVGVGESGNVDWDGQKAREGAPEGGPDWGEWDWPGRARLDPNPSPVDITLAAWISVTDFAGAI